MRLKKLFAGLVIGLLSVLLGCFLYIYLVMNANFLIIIQQFYEQKQIGKIISLGAILNIVLFFGLLHYNKELEARGVVLATIILAIASFIISI